MGVAGVQFSLDGTLLGSELVSPPYSVSWDTTTVPNGSHLLTAIARNTAGISTTSPAISVTVTNDTTAPVLSAVAASGLSSSAATITWTTNEGSSSQVEYGPTTAYGKATPLDASLMTSHSVGLSGLTASTLYHYRVKSKDAAGNLAVSADFTFTTSAAAGTRSPYKGVPFAVPGLIEAEDFDNGGEGVAYHDLVPGNAGGLYRTTEDVDIIANGTGYAVNNIQTGEWLTYSINVAQTGTYRIEAAVSSQFTTSRWHVEIDGVDRTGSILVPSTGSWGTFQYIGKSGVSLTPGQHILKIYAEQEYFNLDALRLVAEDTTAPLATEDFESGTFSGGTGWSGPWTKSGDVSLLINTDGPQQGTSHVRLRRNTGYLQRSVNLLGARNVHLTFWAKVRSFEGSDKALVKVSPDGVTFTTVKVYTSTDSTNTYGYFDADLTSFPMTANFSIAFDAEMSSVGDY